jgi:hypothetical protein
MDLKAAEISAILKEQIKNFDANAEISAAFKSISLRLSLEFLNGVQGSVPYLVHHL